MTDLCMDGTCYGSVFGATIPAPIWHDTMVRALSGTPEHGWHSPPGDYFSQGNGMDPIGVPDVRGMSVSRARSVLHQAGFSVTVDPSPISSTYKKGKVADTSPGPGATVQPGDTITIYTSQGPNLPVFPQPTVTPLR
jgi:hypothetical protein